jgi:hypothetical protein
MGHHYIKEVKDEKFVFSTTSKIIVGAIFVVGLVLAFIGYQGIGHDDHGDHGDHHAKVEYLENSLPVHAVSNNHGEDHGDHHAEEGHGEHGHGEHAEEHGAGHHEVAGGPLERFWANFLMNAYYFLLFGIGALFFWGLNYVANAGWATLIKKIVEAISSYLWFGLATILVVLILGRDYLYQWVRYFKSGITETDPGYDKIIEGKSWILNDGMLLIGIPAFIGIWILFREILKRFSKKEDAEGGTTYFNKSIKFSAGFIAFFAVSFSIMSWVVMMSIDVHWFSTIYSVYNFAIAFVTTMTVIAFFTLYLKSKGYLEVVSDEVIHDIGKFMFAFSIFWAYIWLAQYLLIWYANLPEETMYYAARLTEQYKPMFLVNIFMCFALPFLILMMRNAKRKPIVLLVAGTIILAGHWLDLYLMIMPGVVGVNAEIGMLEIGMTMAFAGIFIFWVLTALSRDNLIPKNHPYLLESANHDVGV